MTRAKSIRELRFEPAQKHGLGFEVFKLSELLARIQREQPGRPPQAPMRFDFHIVYVGLSGRGQVVVDFETAPVGAGWLTAVARGRVHQWTQSCLRCDAWMLLFSEEFLVAGVQGALRRTTLLSSHAGPAFALDPTARRELLTLCELLVAEYTRTLDGVQPGLLASLLSAVLLHAERAARGSTEALPSELARFFSALAREVWTDRSVAHYARAAGLSARRLGELLFEHTGRSTKQLIDEQVILGVKRLLAHSDLPVKELAARAGFSEPTNFVKFFKLHTRETPLEFRARFHHSSAPSHLGGKGSAR